MTNNFVFEPDLAAKTIHVVREFNAPIEKVWRAHTDPDLLDKWVAPKPWTAKTKIWDFTVGGKSLYAMISADGQKHWVYGEFTAIETGSAISMTGMGCDADGNPDTDGPKTYKDTKFISLEGNRSKVDVLITFEDEATIKWFVEGGFKEGTIMSLSNLDELLASE
jgi:uncharacterized protein YndB with AHSA1/START domain